MTFSAQALRTETHALTSAVRNALRGPGRERDLVVQSLKAAGAGLLAWVVARNLLGDPMALMAPWVAVVLVQATVYSSLRQAAQQFTAMCLGALLATAAQTLTGDTTAALALCLPVLMLLGNYPRFGDQGVYAATTALFTLAAGSPVTASALGHRLGQAALGAVIGVAVNAFVLPPVHLRDVRENLAALAHETGRVLHGAADGLRDGEWDEQAAARWSRTALDLERRLDGLRSARRWSEESLRLTGSWLRAFHRVPLDVPSAEEDERWSRVTGHMSTLARTLAVAADSERSPGPPDDPALRSYARLLALIGDACHAEGRRIEGSETGGTDGAAREAMEELHDELQARLRRLAAHSASRTAVLGALLLQAENVWAETVRSR
ncbi:aromatic acid exporter family protein [Streptomyces phyllanthi]|uniref:FUSC family protein n=1 Tax=Streptomyces phyllanthi TaxID=1803180 RepID=A0A5N8W2M4_9ACTN|nr:aromatic acid exporter family protein [Streptomyces phyllanthi]MPY41372.1 FUSC family protein [Streptomyces phyllanthi]